MKSREALVGAEVLALVDRFDHRSHSRTQQAEPHHARALAVPAGLQALALVSFAQRLRARKRRAEHRHAVGDRFRRGMRRVFVLRHL